ncbi:hypothetical protein ACFL9T_03970 [Thermodesulfobacteriota bacterium]
MALIPDLAVHGIGRQGRVVSNMTIQSFRDRESLFTMLLRIYPAQLLLTLCPARIMERNKGFCRSYSPFESRDRMVV